MTAPATRSIMLPKKERERSDPGARSLMAPAAAVVAALVLVPLLVVLRNSFAQADQYGGIEGGFTLDNYLALMDPAYAKTLMYSIGLAVANTVICLVLGYATAYYVTTRPERRQTPLLLLIIIPFWTDFLVRTFAWITLLGSGGPVAALAEAIGSPGFTLIPSGLAVGIGLVYAFLPTAVFPIYASMRSIDPSMREAAEDLGCGWWQTHAKIIAPLSVPGILGAVLLTFVPTMGVFVIPVLLGGGKDQLVGNAIITLYTEFRNQPMGAAASVTLLAMMMASMAVIGALTKRAQQQRKAA